MVVVVVGGIVLHLVKREMELSRRGNVRGTMSRGRLSGSPLLRK